MVNLYSETYKLLQVFNKPVHVTRCQTTFSSRPKDTKRKVHRANTAHSTVGTEGTPVF